MHFEKENINSKDENSELMMDIMKELIETERFKANNEYYYYPLKERRHNKSLTCHIFYVKL